MGERAELEYQDDKYEEDRHQQHLGQAEERFSLHLIQPAELDLGALWNRYFFEQPVLDLLDSRAEIAAFEARRHRRQVAQIFAMDLGLPLFDFHVRDARERHGLAGG